MQANSGYYNYFRRKVVTAVVLRHQVNKVRGRTPIIFNHLICNNFYSPAPNFIAGVAPPVSRAAGLCGPKQEGIKRITGRGIGTPRLIYNWIYMRSQYILFKSILSQTMSALTTSRGQKEPLRMYSDLNEVPIKYQERTCTDVCCIILGVIFFLTMLILSIVLFNYGNYLKSNFAADSNGTVCEVDKPAYPYIYFSDPTSIEKRLCVSKCPSETDRSLDCYKQRDLGCAFNDTSKFASKKYPVEASDSNIGKYCLPKDEGSRKILMQKAKLDDRDEFLKSLFIIFISLFISLGLSILYLVLVQCFPRFMNKAVVFMSALAVLGFAICVTLYEHDSVAKIPIYIALFIAFFILVASFCRRREHIEINGVFLEASTRMLKQSCLSFLYIPIFIALLIGFGFLCLQLYRGFWTNAQLSINTKESLFYKSSSVSSIILSVFLVIFMIWGLSFLKQAFGYCISGNAVSWYHKANWSFFEPFRALWCKHLGSVIGGSYMIGFFTIGDYIFDIIKPDNLNKPQKNDSCYVKCFRSLCSPCIKIFDLVRSDAMAYINLTGNPYCNSARYCEYLSNRSWLTQGSQSISREYRVAAHFLIVSITGIICLYAKGTIYVTALLVIVLSSLFISTFFISIHADASDAIGLSYADHEELQKRKQGEHAVFINGQGYAKDQLNKQPWLTTQVNEVINKRSLSNPSRLQGPL